MDAVEIPPITAGPERVPTVLVVEDEELIRTTAAEYLRECGYRVIEAASGDEAVAVLSAGESVDIVFSDVRMPGERDGIALARWMRAHCPGIRVLLTSGYLGVGRQVSELGADAPFLPKPYRYDALHRHIRQAIDSAG
jgi:CheY-like chemotaxis protein